MLDTQCYLMSMQLVLSTSCGLWSMCIVQVTLLFAMSSGYIVLELATASLFLPFCCVVGYVGGITIKVCALSLYIHVLIV